MNLPHDEKALLAPMLACLCTLVIGLALAAPAAAQNCGSSGGHFITFTFPPGDSPAVLDDVCSDKFRCAMPESSGGYVRKTNAGCNPEAGDCAVELRFPLEFRGNQENIDDVGLSGAPTPVIYWFDGAANTGCRLWQNANCGQVSIRGFGFQEIRTDFREIYLLLGDPLEGPSVAGGTTLRITDWLLDTQGNAESGRQ